MSTQAKIVNVGKGVFGDENMACRNEKLKRFIEEATELARAGGLTNDEIRAVMEFEFSRPVGTDLAQELGGVGCTLYAVADAFGHDLDSSVALEIGRVEQNADKIRARYALKPAIVKQTSGG